MPCQTPPPTPHNPLRSYQFHVYLEPPQSGRIPVGGVQRVSGLTSTIGTYEVWEGGNNLHRYANPDKVTWDPVTLEQGLALDDTLEEWALGVQHFAMTGQLKPRTGAGGGLVEVKRDVLIEVHDPVMDTPAMGAPARCRAFRLRNAWISKYTALPKLDGMASEVALMLVELVHEGWTRELLAPGGHRSTDLFSQPT
jgi:phage tail-like protein